MTAGTEDTRCSWSDLPKHMCACKDCEGTPWPGNLDTPAPIPQPRLVTVWTPLHDKQPTPRDWHQNTTPPTKSTRCKAAGDRHLLPEHLPACADRDCNGCKPCTHDDHGNPITHCAALKGCSEHLDHAHPHTCPRCIGRVRARLTDIERLAALQLDQAEATGTDSTAAMLAGPTAEPTSLERRGLLHVHAAHGHEHDPKHPATKALKAWDADNLDEPHPAYVTRQWEQMLREHYGHPAPRYTDADHLADPRLLGEEKPANLTASISYLAWLLPDLAQDPDQDFAGFADEMATCVTRLEATLSASRAPERGAPCWLCEPPDDADDDWAAPRLVRRRAHWCDKPDCTRLHDTTGANDTWICPNNPDHWWREKHYREITYDDAVAEGMKPRRGRMGA